MVDLCTRSTAEFGVHRPTLPLRSVLYMTRALPRFWWGRTLASVLRKAARNSVGEAVDVDVFQRRMRLHPHDNTCEKRILFTPQFFDHAERRFLREIAGPGFTFVDVGANVGAYSLFVAAACADQARVLAVEPDPMIRSRLEFNIAANDCRCITVVAAAVSDCSGEVELRLNADNRGQNSIVAAEGDVVCVRGVTLQELLDQHGMTRPDCLKLDIEGAEHLVLRRYFEDADPSGAPRAIIIEQIRRLPLTDAARLLLDLGYRIRKRTRMNLILQR